MAGLTERQREIAHYTTLGMACVGLPWREARRIATEIVDEKRGGILRHFFPRHL